MRILAFSDLHTDLGQARRLAERSAEADVVLGVGDFASVHSGLAETIEALRAIEAPAVLVPGNNETEEALREACADWEQAVVLHGEGAEIEGVPFFGLGAGIPVTPWEWSFDLTEEAAAELARGVSGGMRARGPLPAARPRRRERHRQAPGQRSRAPRDRAPAPPPGAVRSHPRELGPAIQDRADPGDQPGPGGDGAGGVGAPSELAGRHVRPRRRPRSRPSRRCGR